MDDAATPSQNPAYENTDTIMLKNTLFAREQEICILRAQLQHMIDSQIHSVDRLERAMSESSDRILRRLDRIENNARHRPARSSSTTLSRNRYN